MERLLLVFDLAINFVKGRLVTVHHGSARAALHLWEEVSSRLLLGASSWKHETCTALALACAVHSSEKDFCS